MKYNVTVSNIKKVNELPGFWSEEKLRGLLAAFEVDGLEDIPAAETIGPVKKILARLNLKESLKSTFEKKTRKKG